VSVPEPEHAIFLQPLEDAESVPLLRWLGREAWRGDPVVSLGYEPDDDRILFRLVDTPSTASGVVDAVHPPDLGGDLFIGFDGTDACAWLTTIVLLGFRLHCDMDTSKARIVRELVGDKIWAAALSLREMAGSERKIRLSPEEAARLIGRWSDLVAGPISEAADAVLAEWSAETAAQTQGGPVADHPASPGSLGARYVSAATASCLVAFAAFTASRSPESARSSVDGGLEVGRRFEELEATGAGAAMARKSPTTPDERPYRILARLSDIWAARRDGKANVPPLPGTGIPAEAADARYGITPYMEIRNRHFLDQAEREHQRVQTDLAETYRMRAEVQQKIVGADEQAATIRRSRERMPNEPADPVRRNVLEQHAHETLVRARRQREWEAERLRMLALEQQAVDTATQLRAQEARLSETIVAGEKLLDSQVRQLLQHSLRRCGTYMHHIVRHHPDGPAVIPYLKLALPDLPAWVKKAPPGAVQADGQGTGARADGQATGVHADGQGTGAQANGQGTGAQANGQATGAQANGQATGAQANGQATGDQANGQTTGDQASGQAGP
jgi:hypothetical protein